nr:hypothetical protein [Tanacetum cinerariifolium]
FSEHLLILFVVTLLILMMFQFLMSVVETKGTQPHGVDWVNSVNTELTRCDALDRFELGAAPPKTKASVRKTQSSSDTTMTPPMAAGTRLLTSTKRKQPAKSSKAKGVLDVPTYESDEEISWKSSDEDDDDDDVDDQSDADDDEDDLTTDEEAKYEESFDPIVQTPSQFENSYDEGNDDESHCMNVGGDKGLDPEDDDEELYGDVNINLEGRDIQMTDAHTTQVLEDTYVTLTLVNPDGQQQSLSVSSQFVTSMLNPCPDIGTYSLFESTHRVDVPVATTVEPFPLSTPTLPPPSIPIISQVQQAPSPSPATAPSSYLQDLTNFGSLFRDTATLKRGCDDEDKDEEPSTRSDGEEPMHITLDEPSHQEFETGDSDNQPVAEASQDPECDLAKQADSRTSFIELMDTPVDFLAFLMNWLKVDTLTPELLAGITYEMMKGSCKSLVELEFFLEEVYKVTTDQLDWNNLEGQQYLPNLLKPLPLIPNYQDTEDMLLLLVQEKLTNLTVEERFAFNVSLRIFTRSIVIQWRMKDLQLGVESYLKKLNLTKPDTYRSDLKRKEAYTAYSNPRGFIYQNKDKQNRLIRIDELHKFSDDALNDVRTALDDRLKGIRIKYLPQTI